MSRNVVPSGFRYQDVCDIVERIASDKARQYKKIAYYDSDDIAQEVRIKCFSTLKNFDPSRSGANLKVFLAVCADNRLKDIKRSVIYKHTTPCMRCDFRNECAAASGIHDCVQYENKSQCERFKKHDRYVMSKLSINSPISIDDRRVIDDTSEHKIERTDFVDYVWTQIPSGMMPLFDKFRGFNFHLQAMKPKERLVIIDVLKGIVDLGDFDRG